MKNDYESATVNAIGSAHDVILGVKEQLPPSESDTDLWCLIMDDDE
jgi:hypothetical protein